jgi:Mg-chelatase subunit ChlD
MALFLKSRFNDIIPIILFAIGAIIFLLIPLFNVHNLFKSDEATMAHYLIIAWNILMALMAIFLLYLSIGLFWDEITSPRRDDDTGPRLKKPAGPKDPGKKTAPRPKPAGSSSYTKPQSTQKTNTVGSQKRHMSSASVKKSHTDLVGLVGFHDRGFIVARPAEPHAHWLQERVASLPKRVAGNSTNMTDGLRKGLEILEKTPINRYRRIWLLTDGKNNREQNKLMSMVAQAGLLHVNINTIGFGNPGSIDYDPDMLKKISGATHNGRFVPISSLRELSKVLQTGNRVGLGNRKAETTVLVIDCSLSMNADMEGKRRIEVVVEAITHLLHYKQKCFS